jgi:hypothetical protein
MAQRCWHAMIYHFFFFVQQVDCFVGVEARIDGLVFFEAFFLWIVWQGRDESGLLVYNNGRG